MSILPSFKAVLDDSLSAKECGDVVGQIKNIKGVLSAAFNEESNQKQVLVTYCFTLNSINNSVEDKVRNMAGVKDIKPVL